MISQCTKIPFNKHSPHVFVHQSFLSSLRTAAVILCQFRVQCWWDYSPTLTYGFLAIYSTFSYTWAPRADIGLISSYAILLCRTPLSLPCYDVSAKPPFFEFKLPDMLPSCVNEHQLIVNACFVLLPVFTSVSCLALFTNAVLSTSVAYPTTSNSFLTTVWLIISTSFSAANRMPLPGLIYLFCQTLPSLESSTARLSSSQCN